MRCDRNLWGFLPFLRRTWGIRGLARTNYWQVSDDGHPNRRLCILLVYIKTMCANLGVGYIHIFMLCPTRFFPNQIQIAKFEKKSPGQMMNRWTLSILSWTPPSQITFKQHPWVLGLDASVRVTVVVIRVRFNKRCFRALTVSCFNTLENKCHLCRWSSWLTWRSKVWVESIFSSVYSKCLMKCKIHTSI